MLGEFQSTLPVGGATRSGRRGRPGNGDFNPRSPWGERLLIPGTLTCVSSISIHAPRGGATGKRRKAGGGKIFQSTLPVGGATQHYRRGREPKRFQSTLPVGGATIELRAVEADAIHFNPRSPWGERRRCSGWRSRRIQFQSTLPVGGATRAAAMRLAIGTISIHAPRGGSDLIVQLPCDGFDSFQSTLPVGGATVCSRLDFLLGLISIHAPRGGSDLRRSQALPARIDFNPRSPWGERRFLLPLRHARQHISIHAPRGGSDCTRRRKRA